jgi:hypothetical protein
LLELKHKDRLRLPFHDDSGLRVLELLEIPTVNVALLCQLIMARILHPTSKRRRVQFINKSFGAGLDEEKIYRFMDSISKSQSKIPDKVGTTLQVATPDHLAAFCTTHHTLF